MDPTALRPAEEAVEEAQGYVADGFGAIKMKIGLGDPRRDIARADRDPGRSDRARPCVDRATVECARASRVNECDRSRSSARSIDRREATEGYG